MREIEKEYIKKVLLELGGNKSKTAAILGLDRKTLYRKLQES
jgi:DNA-binding NtrC family response regulator